MKKIISKTSKIFASVLVVMMLFVVGATNTTAASVAPNTINIDRVEVLSDLVTNHEHGFTVFNTTDGHWIYCMDVDKKSLYQNQGATLVGNGDAGLLYILQNGYPNKAITGNKEIDKYITQAVVWWYVNEGKMSDEFKNATKKTDRYELVPNRIKPMVEKARAAKDTQAKPSMKLQTNGTTLTLTKDGKYYESALMSASLVGAKTYTASAAGTKGTIVTDENGKSKTTFNSSERFKVRVPASEVSAKTTVKVTTKAEGTVQQAKIYKPADTNYQRVVGLYDEVTPLSQSAELTATPKVEKHVCEVVGDKYYGSKGTVVDKKTYEKECEKSCQYVDGKYYGKAGNVVDKKTFDKECNKTCEYVDGKYYGKEGNEVDQATYDQECGQVVEVPNTSANISPLAIAGGVLIIGAGAGLVLYRNRKLNNLM